MKTRVGLAAVAALVCASTANADVVTASYGWEDGGTTFGSNLDNLEMFNNSDLSYVQSGSRSLGLTEDPTSGTPRAWICYITGLTDGDIIDANFWAWDNTESTSPSLRIWGNYAAGGDLSNDLGSAGGSNTYSSGTDIDPWSNLSNQWTFDSNGGVRDTLVIQVRFYASSSGGPDINTLFVDDLTVAVDAAGDAVIHTPVPTPGALALLGLAGLAGRRRRRN